MEDINLKIEFNNKTGSSLEEIFLFSVIKATLEREGFFSNLNKQAILSIAAVSEKEIRRLNKKYRQKDASTDILSFAEHNNQNDLKNIKSNKIFLGELVLCYNDIKKYVEGSELFLKKELAKVISHGTLHLLGLSHGKKMFALQEEIAEYFR